MDIEIPGYSLLQVLGKGGMATVFLAKQDVLERKVALKVMSYDLAQDPSFGQRFIGEAKIVSQLVHPNIVTVHEVGQHKGHYYLSMEYIDGHDLRTVRKKLDIEGKIRAIEDIARALHYAGEKGYVHRDIKPENIMFRSMDGSAVLTDFGIAKAVKTDLTMTQTGTAIGTPYYMSPEQAKGKVVDHRSDLYGLGVVFYLLLTGRVPYNADTAIAIGIKHITEPVPTLPSELSVLQPVLDGLMAKDPQDRYQNGLSLLNDLRCLDLREIVESADVLTSQITMPSDVVDEALSDKESDSHRFTIEFDVDDAEEKPPQSIWPLFFATAFIVCAIATIVYISRPAALVPFIQSVEKKSTDMYGAVIDRFSSGGQYLQQKFSRFSDNKEDSPEEPVIETNVEPVKVKEASANKKPVVITPKADRVLKSMRKGAESLRSDIDQIEPEVDAMDIPSRDDLYNALFVLRDDSEKDASAMPQYVRAHRDILTHYPNDADVLASLELIKQTRKDALFAEADKGNSEGVENQLKIYSHWFPESQAGEWQQLSQEAGRRLVLYALSKRAKQQMSLKQFASPEGDNALESYQRILELDQQNEPAQIALMEISSELENHATKFIKQGEFDQAILVLIASLKADPNNDTARALKQEAEQAVSHQNRIAQSLVNAQKYVELGYLYAPEGGNAFDHYQQVLALDIDNVDAKQGVDMLLDKLSVKVWSLVGDEKFDEAKAALTRPAELLPDSERIRAMVIAVDEVSLR